MDNQAKMLRVSEVASRLNCSLSTVYQLIETGQLPSHNVGLKKVIRVSEDDLREFIERRRTAGRQRPAPAQKPTGNPFKHLDGERLRAAWRRQGVPFDPPDERSAPSSAS